MLLKNIQEPQKPFPNITHTDEIKNHILSYKELKKLKLEDYAKEILNDLNTHRFSLDSRKYLISFYKKINHTAGQIVNSIRIFYDYKEERSLVSLRDIFPIRQEETIKSTLARLQFKKIPSTLILSLIRQESAFDPEAISRANAKGLMQLIPPTAKEVARRLKVKEYALDNPQDNILLGTRYLYELLNKFSSNPIYALSAYNAGPRAAERWVRYRGRYPSEKFVETIPYLETSKYVKLIARNYVLYQLLYPQNSKAKLKYLF